MRKFESGLRVGLPTKWSFTADLMRSRLPQITSLIPAFGYAVLWSDQFSIWILRYDTTFGNQQLLSVPQRIQLLYFGSCLILCGMVVFWLGAPRRIRQYRTRTEYVAAMEQIADDREIGAAANYLLARAPRVKDQLNPAGWFIDVDVALAATRTSHSPEAAKPILPAFYDALDNSRPILSTLAALLMLVGGGLFLVPSVEVFLLALLQIAGQLASPLTFP